MPKRYYILVMLLISVKFWGFELTAPLMSNTHIVCAIAVLWMIIGVLLYRKDTKTLFSKMKYRCLNWIMYIAIFLSVLSTIMFYGQSVFHSALALEELVFYLFFPLLLWITPSIKDIKFALVSFSFLWILAELMFSVFNLPLFRQEIAMTEASRELDFKESGDFVRLLKGVEFIALAFFLVAAEVRRSFSISKVIMMFLLFVFIFIAQNRTTLFPCLIVLVYVLFTMKGQKSTVLLARGTSIAVAGIAFTLTMPYWTSLLTETLDQVGDRGYVRNLSYAYFMFEAWPNIWCLIFGNGFLYGKTKSYDIDFLGEQGIWSNDVGFVGMWTLTGFIPIILIIVLCFMSLFGKNRSLSLRFNAFFILCASATTAWFYNPNTILWLCFFFYFFVINDYFKRHKTIIVKS